jgi:hypothetical protein
MPVARASPTLGAGAHNIGNKKSITYRLRLINRHWWEGLDNVSGPACLYPPKLAPTAQGAAHG